MSGIVNKVKEVLHSDKSSSHSEGTHTHAGTTAGHTTGTTGTSGLHESSHISGGTHEGAYGSTGLDSNRHNAQKTDGPHGNLGNKLDPRVDSDRDHSRNLGANPDRSANTTSHNTSHTAGTGLTGSHGHTGTTGTTGFGTTGLDSDRHNAQRTDGPHGNLGNKLDPRVDSDRDHSRNLGANPDRSAHTAGTTGGLTGSHGNTGGLTGSHGTSGLTGSHGTTGTTGTSGFGSTGLDSDRHNVQRTDGPHGNLGNKLDPRVDSDRDHSRNLGANPDRSANAGAGLGSSGVPGSHATGAGAHSTGLNTGHTLGSTTGTHTGAHTGTHAGGLQSSHATGPAPNTQGPHKSDLLNKADPRVDSDADGSKTYGGNKTYDH